MQLTNTPTQYGLLTKLLHWISAFALIGLFGLGIWMVELDYYSNWYHQVPFVHKSIGVLIVLLMIARFFWHLASPTPKHFENTPPPQQKWIHRLHLSFYFWVLLLGLSGYLISTAEGDPVLVFNWFEIPSLMPPIADQAQIAGDIHKWLAYGFIAIIGLHIIAALYHHFWVKDNTLRKIIFTKQTNDSTQ